MKRFLLILVISTFFINYSDGQIFALTKIASSTTKLIAEEAGTSKVLYEEIISTSDGEKYKKYLSNRGSSSYKSIYDFYTDLELYKYLQEKGKKETDALYNQAAADARKAAIEILQPIPVKIDPVTLKLGVPDYRVKWFKEVKKTILNKRLRGIIVLYNLPIAGSLPASKAYFRNTFNLNLSKSQEKVLYQTSIGIGKAKDEKLIRVDSMKNLLAILKKIKKIKKDGVIIIGHNEGGTLVLPSGEKISLSILDSLKSGLNILVLSCKANLYTSSPSANFNLTFAEAFKIVDEFNGLDYTKQINKDSAWAANATSIIEKFNQNKNRLYNLTLIKIGAGVVGTLYLVEFISKLFSYEEQKNNFFYADVFVRKNSK